MVMRGQMPPQARWVVEPDQGDGDGDDGGADAMLSQIGPR